VIVQIFIAVTELIAIWLMQDKRADFRKFAPVFGMLGTAILVLFVLHCRAVGRIYNVLFLYLCLDKRVKAILV
jgi:hypothetical protein